MVVNIDPKVVVFAELAARTCFYETGEVRDPAIGELRHMQLMLQSIIALKQAQAQSIEAEILDTQRNSPLSKPTWSKTTKYI